MVFDVFWSSCTWCTPWGGRQYIFLDYKSLQKHQKKIKQVFKRFYPNKRPGTKYFPSSIRFSHLFFRSDFLVGGRKIIRKRRRKKREPLPAKSPPLFFFLVKKLVIDCEVRERKWSDLESYRASGRAVFSLIIVNIIINVYCGQQT